MPIQKGSRVILQYRLVDVQGNLLDESHEPVSFIVGKGEILPAFEDALLGKEAGETCTFTLGPEEAFGEWREELIFRVPREKLQGQDEPPLEAGQTVTLYTPEGDTVTVYVREAGEDFVEFDANHPLAGQTLTYTVQVLQVE